MISTNLDVKIETFPRKAGIESGRLFNDWLDCPFQIRPHSSIKNFEWVVHYNATDTASDAGGFLTKKIFSGLAFSRPEAHRLLIDCVTRHIKAVVDARELYIKRMFGAARLSIDAGIPLAAPLLLPIGTLNGTPAYMPLPESPTVTPVR